MHTLLTKRLTLLDFTQKIFTNKTLLIYGTQYALKNGRKHILTKVNHIIKCGQWAFNSVEGMMQIWSPDVSGLGPEYVTNNKNQCALVIQGNTSYHIHAAVFIFDEGCCISVETSETLKKSFCIPSFQVEMDL